MLRALTNLVLLGLCPLAISAAEVTNGVNNRILFASMSGMHLTEPSLKTLAMAVQEDASFYSVRASVKLTEDDFKALARRKTFLIGGIPRSHHMTSGKGRFSSMARMISSSPNNLRSSTASTSITGRRVCADSTF